MQFLSYVWNPSTGIDLGFFLVRYYSLMFVIAFSFGWFFTKKIYQRENISLEKLDKLFLITVLATLLGARLGHVIFYQPELIKQDPLAVLLPIRTVPEFEFTGFQGLASHGAAVAILIAMYYYSKKVLKKPILWILDRVVLAVAFGAGFVRIGNFFNSEIIGKPTGTDSGVIFAQLGENFARYPTQLFEAGGYFIVAATMFYLYWKTEKRKYLGYIFGVFMIMLWSVRLIVEFWKEPQEGEIINYVLNTGQWLSVPFILLGIYLVINAKKKGVNPET
ncbi:MAG TPA: prolipoprotein diacylglyceryl transferase [Flavobacteriaceae bacterium]|nr:prolipoprotein diacylglyceryl transferase [Flavobacteriaceae bacterium]